MVEVAVRDDDVADTGEPAAGRAQLVQQGGPARRVDEQRLTPIERYGQARLHALVVQRIAHAQHDDLPM